MLIVPFSIGFRGFMSVIAVALQRGAGLGPVPAGPALAPMAVVFFFVSLTGPRLVARYGTRVATAGAGPWRWAWRPSAPSSSP
ncbi:putative transmembrane efflux protein [Streptomyces viridochromogenes Tue57]|uniref:Putative transmembrane efflux protein n=1 Tax=Streptomyces viridochromogenes Tue57 TaxID=1160705 RepID=L8P661_STRVR|nr:putative transmembrane efflux protein [Streptomyces viridochromogenes Tue57]